MQGRAGTRRRGTTEDASAHSHALKHTVIERAGKPAAPFLFRKLDVGFKHSQEGGYMCARAPLTAQEPQQLLQKLLLRKERAERTHTT